MDARHKRRLLAALENELLRWALGRDNRRHRRVTVEILRRLQAMPALPQDADFPRRIATGVSRLRALADQPLLLSAALTLVRADCLLWQLRLAAAPSSAAPATDTPSPAVVAVPHRETVRQR